MSLYEHQRQRAIEIREEAGLPVTLCPKCGLLASHWVPESLEGPGYFTCDRGETE